MLQVVFSDSEKGAISLAMDFSKDMNIGIGVFQSDNGNATQEEMDKALADAKIEWEEERLRGRPLEGNHEDIIGIVGNLDYGEIRTPLMDSSRQNLIREFFCTKRSKQEPEPEILEEHAKQYWDSCVKDYHTLMARAKNGEAVRIWYSSAAYSLCGFYSILYELRELDCTVTAIQLPRALGADFGVGWGEIPPGDWASCLSLETPITKAERMGLAEIWRKLKQENAPMRASVNGILYSVDISFYDGFIRKEIPHTSFIVARLIGSVLGKSQLAISDWIIAQRIQNMIDTGELNVLQNEAEFYEWVLKKADTCPTALP